MAESKQRKQKAVVTSYCVAEAAGVSQSAVSRAYKPGGSVSKKTREKIYKAAKQLGYRPNAIARSLISRKSNIIGIVMADIANPFYPSVLECTLKLLQSKGLRGIVIMADRDQQVDDLLPQLLEYQVDGLIITSATLSSEMADQCAGIGVPVVLFNRSVPGSKASAVCCDNSAAARQVAELFIDRGMTRLSYIAGVEDTSTNRDRESSFFQRVSEAGLSKPTVASGHYTYAGGYQAALELCSGENPPEAIFCANDIMAMGAMDAIRTELKLSIPEDISIVGFDDIENCNWPIYNLTSVRPPVERMVKRSVESLLTNQNPEDSVQVVETMAAKIVHRGTVRG
jgi:DNA-binding LacI/PurR family transcriptional regulator